MTQSIYKKLSALSYEENRERNGSIHFLRGSREMPQVSCLAIL